MNYDKCPFFKNNFCYLEYSEGVTKRCTNYYYLDENNTVQCVDFCNDSFYQNENSFKCDEIVKCTNS